MSGLICTCSGGTTVKGSDDILLALASEMNLVALAMVFYQRIIDGNDVQVAKG